MQVQLVVRQLASAFVQYIRRWRLTMVIVVIVMMMGPSAALMIMYMPAWQSTCPQGSKRQQQEHAARKAPTKPLAQIDHGQSIAR